MYTFLTVSHFMYYFFNVLNGLLHDGLQFKACFKGEILGIRSVIAKHMLFWYFIFKSLLRWTDVQLNYL
jgi:hypothetical protein